MLHGSCHCGRIGWQAEARPTSATICNCTTCRRYGVLWVYGFEGEGMALEGDTNIYMNDSGRLEFHFCPTCGCLAAWRAVDAYDDGRRRMALNLRLSEDQDSIRTIPLDRFDGLESFEPLPRDGRSVGDVVF